MAIGNSSAGTIMKCDKTMEVVYTFSLDVEELCALDNIGTALLQDTTNLEVNEHQLKIFQKFMKDVHAMRVGDKIK